MSSEPRAAARPTAFALFTIIAGAIGWFASFELLTEYVKTLQNPDYVPNCAVSVLVTCGPNMGSWQGSLFGFSNTILGVAGFMAPILVGFALLAGARFARWFWIIYQIGLFAAFVFVFWLFSQSVYSLGTLCPWCMVVWTVTIPLFWITMFRPVAAGDVAASPATRTTFQTLLSWSWVLILVSYLIIAFLAQLQLNWLGEFSRNL